MLNKLDGLVLEIIQKPQKYLFDYSYRTPSEYLKKGMLERGKKLFLNMMTNNPKLIEDIIYWNTLNWDSTSATLTLELLHDVKLKDPYAMKLIREAEINSIEFIHKRGHD